MKLALTLLLSMAISHSFAIKIKILKKKIQQSQPSIPGAGPVMGGYQVKQTCDDIAPGIAIADLFSVYTEQLMSIFKDNVNELRLVKYESQVVAGMNFRLIFRVRDLQTQDKLYYGFGLFRDLQGGVRITAYRESFDLDEVVKALGFADSRLYGYPCGKINDQAVKGFETWAEGLVTCPAVQPVAPQQNSFDNLNSFGSNFQNQNPAPSTFNQAPQNFNQTPQTYNQTPQTYNQAPQNYNQAPQTYTPTPQAPQTYNPTPQAPQTYNPTPQAPAVTSGQDFGTGDDSPFTTINLKIKTTDSNGNPIIIGNKRPPKIRSN